MSNAFIPEKRTVPIQNEIAGTIQLYQNTSFFLIKNNIDKLNHR